MRVLNDYVLIKPLKEKQAVSKSGLVIPNKSTHLRWEVINFWPGILSLYTGVVYPIIHINAGAEVIYKDTGWQTVVEDWVEMILVSSVNILAVV